MSAPQQQVLSIEETVNRDYQLDISNLYEYPNSNPVKVLHSCPLLSEIRVTDSAYSTGNQFVFDLNIAENQFISNVFNFQYTLPLIVKLKTASDVAITPLNFMEKIFNNNDDIILAQQAISQAIIYSDVSLNGTTFQTVNDIPELSNITSAYWNVGDTAEYIQASQPDRFQDFDKYSGSANQSLKFIDNSGNVAYTTISPMNEQNLFASKYQSGFSTRTPQWEFVKANEDKKTIQVRVNLWSYLKFSIGSIPSAESTLTGIRRLGFTQRLMSNSPHYIFNVKDVLVPDPEAPTDPSKATRVFRYEDIVFDTAEGVNAKCRLYTKLITPPQYLMDQAVDPTTRMLKPYSISYPRIQCLKFNTDAGVAFNTTKTFNQASTMLNAIPRSIYVAMVKQRKGNFESVAKTPVNFGLIKNLTVQIDSASTNIPDINAIDHIITSNGYSEMDQLGRLVKGYPIKLNLGKDLFLPSDTVVGAAGRFNLSVNGNYTNQGDVAADYQLVLVIVYDDQINFKDGQFSQSSGVLVPQQLFQERYFLKTLYDNYQRELDVVGAGKDRFGGGKFGDAMRWIGRNALKLVKNAWANRDKIAETIGDVTSVVKAVRGGGLQYSNVSGGANTITLGAGSVQSRLFK